MIRLSRNALIHALLASAYIFAVVALLNTVTQVLENKADTAFAPVAFLSSFTLSAAIMAYLFFYQPILLLLESKKKEAVELFFQTLLIFGFFTTVFWIVLLAGLI